MDPAVSERAYRIPPLLIEIDQNDVGSGHVRLIPRRGNGRALGSSQNTGRMQAAISYVFCMNRRYQHGVKGSIEKKHEIQDSFRQRSVVTAFFSTIFGVP